VFSLSILNIYFKNQYKAALTNGSPPALSYFSNLLYFLLNFLWESFFEFSILDIYKCPFFDFSEFMFEKIDFVTIIEFYGVVTKKIIFILL
jgi:hypothetical protein